jgi:3-methyl-2-oxobutanoate hydroxymethyltransferase
MAVPSSGFTTSIPGPEIVPLERPVTIRTLRQMVASGEAFPCLTAYDALTAGWLQQAGVPVLLVGDTAAEVILGLPTTIHAPLEFMITLTAAVKRGAPKCWVVGDMPFLSYQVSESEAIRNGGRFLVEGHADAVKLEVDEAFAPLVRRMSQAGIPVIAHIGSRPQHVGRHGGYYSDGRSADDARRLVDEARLFEDAGAVMILVEAVPQEVAAAIVEAVDLPVIGCGAGPACHGQIVVTHDLTGMTEWQPPFAQPIAPLGQAMVHVAAHWADRVRRRAHGEHPYRMREGESEQLSQRDDAADGTA